VADVIYTLQSVPKHAGENAERSAVLWPLTGVRPDLGDAETDRGVQQVLALWRFRCLELHREGYPMFAGVKFQYARNCPPAGVVTSPDGGVRKLKRCGHSAVCPWCWSRLVVRRTFDQVVETLSGLGETYDRASPGLSRYKLVATSLGGVDRDAKGQPRARLNLLDATMRRSKRRFEKVAAGMAMLSVVAPSKSGWAYSTRFLVLVPRDYPTKDGAVEYALLTRRAVARAVARFARYPKGVLTGDLGRTMRLLEARGEYRLLRFGGVFTKLHGKGAKGPAGPAPRYLDL